MTTWVVTKIVIHQLGDDYSFWFWDRYSFSIKKSNEIPDTGVNSFVLFDGQVSGYLYLNRWSSLELLGEIDGKVKLARLDNMAASFVYEREWLDGSGQSIPNKLIAFIHSRFYLRWGKIEDRSMRDQDDAHSECISAVRGVYHQDGPFYFNVDESRFFFRDA